MTQNAARIGHDCPVYYIVGSLSYCIFYLLVVLAVVVTFDKAAAFSIVFSPGNCYVSSSALLGTVLVGVNPNDELLVVAGSYCSAALNL